jgi:hypothetical protein
MTKTWLVEASSDGKTWRTMRIPPFDTRAQAAAKARQFTKDAAANHDYLRALRAETRFRPMQYVPLEAAPRPTAPDRRRSVK